MHGPIWRCCSATVQSPWTQEPPNPSRSTTLRASDRSGARRRLLRPTASNGATHANLLADVGSCGLANRTCVAGGPVGARADVRIRVVVPRARYDARRDPKGTAPVGSVQSGAV